MSTTTATSYNLERNVFSGVPSLVSQAMGPARQWFSGALEWVCGEPDTLRATGQQYAELGTKVQQVAQQLGSDQALVPSWTGHGHDAFAATSVKAADVLTAVGEYTTHTQAILNAAAQVAVEAANMIWDLVTELVRWLVTTLMQAMATSTVSFGSSIAAWLGTAIGQVARVVGKVAQVCGKVGRLLMKVVQLLEKVTALIAKYEHLLTEIEQILRKVYDRSSGLRKDLGDVPEGVSWQQYRDATPAERAAMMGGSDTSSAITGSSDPTALGTDVTSVDGLDTTDPDDADAVQHAEASSGLPYATGPSGTTPAGAGTQPAGTVAAGAGTSSTGTPPTGTQPPQATTDPYRPSGSMSATTLPPSSYPTTGSRPSGGARSTSVRCGGQQPLPGSSASRATAGAGGTAGGGAGGTAMPPLATMPSASRASGRGMPAENRDEWSESDAEAEAERAMDGSDPGTMAAGVGGASSGVVGAGATAAGGVPAGMGATVADLPPRAPQGVGGTATAWTTAGPAATAPPTRVAPPTSGGSDVSAMAMPPAMGGAGSDDESTPDGPALTANGGELAQSLDQNEEAPTGVIDA